MKKLSTKFNVFQNCFLIIFSLIFFQAIGIYNEKACSRENPNNKNCSLIKNSKITYPSQLILKAFSELEFLFKNNFRTSGRLVKKLQDTSERFKSLKSGFNFYYEKGSRDNAGYLLLSGGDPYKDGQPFIQLWDMNKQKLIHKWDFNMDKVLRETGVVMNKNSVSFKHPLLLEDGNIIVSHALSAGPLTKFSPNGKVLKFNSDFQFHHSVEKDLQDNLYVPIRREKSKLYSDGFAILDQDLNVLETHYLDDIYRKADLEYDLYSENATNDPFHLNDVEPLKNNTRTRFVLLSLAHQSSIIAYDLQKRNIVWILKGYSMKQHDPDFLTTDGTQISIFDNNQDIPESHFALDRKVKNNNFTIIKNLPPLNNKKTIKTRIYNKASNHYEENRLEIIKRNFDFLESKRIPRTLTEGLSEIIFENDSIFIEETNYGRLLEIDFKKDELLWEYINKDNKESYYMMGWSRRLKDIDDSTIKKLSSIKN